MAHLVYMPVTTPALLVPLPHVCPANRSLEFIMTDDGRAAQSSVNDEENGR
jgi:hypothetical protein